MKSGDQHHFTALWSKHPTENHYRGAISFTITLPWVLKSYWGVTGFGGPHAARNWTGRKRECVALVLYGSWEFYLRSPSGRIWSYASRNWRGYGAECIQIRRW